MSSEAENLMGDVLEQEAEDPDFALRLQLLEYRELEESLPDDLRPAEDDLEARLALLRDIAGEQYMIQQQAGIEALMTAADLPEAEEETGADQGEEGEVLTRARFLELLRHAHEAGFGIAFLNEHFSEQLVPEVDVDNMSYEDLLELGDRIGKVNIGLSPSQIESRTTIVICPSNCEDSCTICCTEFTEGEELRKLSCPHMFHKECVDQWLSESKKCPLCKTEVVELPVQDEPMISAIQSEEEQPAVVQTAVPSEGNSATRTPQRTIRKRKNRARPATAAEARNNALLIR